MLLGMLPYVDNNAHVGGFIFGTLAGLVFMPHIYFGKWDKKRKIFFRIAAIPAGIYLFYFCLVSFYDASNFCYNCKYLNCIPGLPWCDQKWNVATYVNWTINPNYNY